MSNKKTIIALCAHPDDAEIRCSGTLILLARAGWDIHIATFAMGDCGSAEESPEQISARRRKEAEAAAAKVGGTYHCLDFFDLQVFDDNPTRAAATSLLREVDPDCIITHYPIDYMADHITASAVARTVVFTAPIKNYLVGSSASHPPTTKGVIPLYYFGPLEGTDFFGNKIEPQFYVDISSVMEQKAEMLACHTSQRDWLRKQHGVDEYIEGMKQWDAEAGKVVGVSYAEGLFMHKGHGYPRTPLIQDALADFIR